MSELVQVLNIENRIYTIRGIQVMLDRDLAELYEVETRALKQAVKRNRARFPSDFMFELTENEVESLVSQSVIPSKKQLGEYPAIDEQTFNSSHDRILIIDDVFITLVHR